MVIPMNRDVVFIVACSEDGCGDTVEAVFARLLDAVRYIDAHYVSWDYCDCGLYARRRGSLTVFVMGWEVA